MLVECSIKEEVSLVVIRKSGKNERGDSKRTSKKPLYFYVCKLSAC